MQNQTSSALHNAIMEASGKDRPPMLAPDVNATPVTPSNEGTSQPQQPRGSCSNHSYGIDNDIYSTVDACPNAIEMWKAIERLKQGESLKSYYSRFYKMINELVRNQCIVTNHQVNVQFLLKLKPEWQMFMTIVKKSQDLKNVSYHKLYDILKQHQNEVNEIRVERLAHPISVHNNIKTSNSNNNNMQNQTSSALHNAIMEASGKDRPPMLAPGKNFTTTITKGEVMETFATVPEDIQKWITAEAEDVQIILRKFTSQEGESLKSYYSRFYKMINELVRNQCIVTNHQVNVQFLLKLKPEWQMFMTIVKKSQDLKNVSYHKLYDILKQHQNEVNEIRVERLARTVNPLALVAQQQQQPVCHHQPNLTHYTQSLSTRSQATTRNIGEGDYKIMALILMSFKKIYKPTNNNLRTLSNTRNLNVDNTPRSSRGIGYDRQTGQYDNKRAVNVAGARENVGTQRQHPEQPESVNDTYLIEQGDTNITHDSSDMSNNGEEADQDDQMLQKERQLLASLIDQINIKIDGSKQHNKTLESSNKALK
ncbi:hypothetical protein Tco_1016291 [Tanacetum coccineum]|uniref:Gag-Pol polyprotein n=1 Tax=Tanacetum coccineum TaxID=301880 RepID=A0ABQ5FN74_9ASTR